jgi:phage minor structural protein
MEMSKPISVYDNRTRKRLAYLENAYDISYDKSTNSIWNATFSLPFSDPKTKYCQAFNYIELWEEGEGGKAKNVGLFRIMPRTEEVLGTEANIVYQLENVLTTLLDDVMIGYHEIGNLGIFTNQVLGYILERQTDRNWVLGNCAYSHQFLYGWQDENLLSALFSVVQPFEETDYYWSFDTTEYPWRLNLLKTDKTPVTDIRYKKNLNGLTRTIDPSNLTTRLYCYGYGQGDNKLGISELNGGVPYLESPNVSKYGVITQIWTDERFTIAESLYEVGKTMLKRLEEPAISYAIDVQAVYNTANLDIGDTVRMVSTGLDELMTVRTISKDNVTGAPHSGTILLGDATIDISNSVAELADRQRIAETYSQGAESIFTDSFVDNADQTNPAEVIFTIPDNVVHVNEIRFSCQLTNFRAYSKAIQGGGSGMSTTLDGGSQTKTSSSGGSSTPTSSSGGGSSPTSSSGGGVATTTSSGGGSSPTSSNNGSVNTTIGVYNKLPDSNSSVLHNHGISSGTPIYSDLNVVKNSAGVVTGVNRTGYAGSWSPSGNHSHYINISAHSHTVTVRDHSHDISISNHTHYTTIAPHTHTVSIGTHTHTVAIDAHKHDISLPNHVHGIEYGIYKGPKASSMTIYLDDTKIGVYTSNITDLNLIDYMSKNANGNIMRGKHTIRIVPNTMTRVECTFQIRLFTNMHGGRQY